MKHMNKYSLTTLRKVLLWALPVSALNCSILSGVVLEEDFEAAAVGTLSSETHPGWTGMLPDNQTGSSIDDWKIVEGAGLDYVAPDGGTISGGNRHFEMRSVSNVTGRAYLDFDAPLPTDIGEATSIYLRYAVAFDQFENIADPEATWTVWPLVRFNGSWQMRSILKFDHNDWRAEKDEDRFFAELHNDVDAVAGINTVVFLEDKLGAPQPGTTYLVVTRYDFNDAGDLLGQAIWVNPSFADDQTPDLVSNHAQPGYSTFLNPIVSMDITTYGGTMRFDNIMIASSWGEVVPAAGATWAGYPLDSSNNADTGDWLGFVNVVGDWVWSYSLATWIYLPEDQVTEAGAWTFIPKL